MKLAAKWTDDCMEKKSYDGKIISISTRYWPRGGGFFSVQNNPGKLTIEENEDRPEIKPSATSRLVIYHGDPEDPEHAEIAKQKFEGETFEEVRNEVEAWAQEQMDRVVGAIRHEFSAPSRSG